MEKLVHFPYQEASQAAYELLGKGQFWDVLWIDEVSSESTFCQLVVRQLL
jgi:hypothetical protein